MSRTMAKKKILQMSVAVGHESEIGVAVAEYSGHLSRMWAWQAKTLEVIGFQDVRAGVELLDVTETGTYCAYRAHSLSRNTQYIAVSKPPYFTALWIRNDPCFSGSKVRFSRESFAIRYADPEAGCEGRLGEYTRIEERTEPECPFQIQPISRGSKELRDSSPRVKLDYLYSRLSVASFSTDPQGREVGLLGSSLCADGVPFINCARTPLVQVVPPDWAKHW